MRSWMNVHAWMIGLLLALAWGGTAWAQCGIESLQPTNVAPADGLENVSLAPTLEIEADASGGCRIKDIVWQLATTPDFSYDGLTMVVLPNLNRYTVSSKNALAANTTYYWRAAVTAVDAASGKVVQSTFSDAWSLTTQSCGWPEETAHLEPLDGADVSLTPTLVWRQSFVMQTPACPHDATEWQIATDADFDPGNRVFFDPLDIDNLFEFAVPDGLLVNNTTYHWRARMKTFSGIVSDWTPATSFVTPVLDSEPCNWGVVRNEAPPDGQIFVALVPTLTISVSPGEPPLCSHDRTQWQVAADPAFEAGSLVYGSGDVAGGLLQHTLSAGLLAVNTTYYWRARIKSQDGAVSEWGRPSKFATAIEVTTPRPCAWPPIQNVAPASNAVDVAATPSLQIQVGQGPLECSLDATQWQIAVERRFGENAVVFDSGVALTDATSLVVPVGVLQPGVAYFWRARLASDQGLPGAWSSPTAFTVTTSETPVAPTPTPVPTPSPVQPGSPASCGLDELGEGDGIIGDDDMLLAVRLWVDGEMIPDTNTLIDDATMLALIPMWVSAQPFACEGEGAAASG